MNNAKLRMFAGALASASLLSAAPSGAASLPLTFGCITNNNISNCSTGASQLSVNVTDVGVAANQVKFIFNNIGSLASSITDIYFDGPSSPGALLSLAGLIDKDDGVGDMIGVDFTQDSVSNVAPPDLTGGNAVNFVTTAGFSADSDMPVSPNGVNPGEWLGVIFSLNSGKNFSDVVNEFSTGALRIGMRVQSFSSGGGESFVNAAAVPLPAAAFLLAPAVVGLGMFRRRSRTVQ